MAWSHLSSVFFYIDIVHLSIVNIYVIIIQLLFSNTDIQFLMNFSLSFDQLYPVTSRNCGHKTIEHDVIFILRKRLHNFFDLFIHLLYFCYCPLDCSLQLLLMMKRVIVLFIKYSFIIQAHLSISAIVSFIISWLSPVLPVILLITF